jgi:hypothetical protein
MAFIEFVQTLIWKVLGAVMLTALPAPLLLKAQQQQLVT